MPGLLLLIPLSYRRLSATRYCSRLYRPIDENCLFHPPLTDTERFVQLQAHVFDTASLRAR